jgi:hypothetical protein
MTIGHFYLHVVVHGTHLKDALSETGVWLDEFRRLDVQALWTMNYRFLQVAAPRKSAT